MSLVKKIRGGLSMLRNLYRNFGNKVRERRILKGCSQEKLAEMCDVSTSYIGLVERGERKPSLDIVVGLSNSLGISTDYLLSDSLEIRESTKKDKLQCIINDLDEYQLDTAFQVMDQIHNYMTNRDSTKVVTRKVIEKKDDTEKS